MIKPAFEASAADTNHKNAWRGALWVALWSCAVHARAMELVSIPSQDGKLTIPAYWFPVDAAEPRPAVVMLHGCSGTLDEKGNLSSSRRIDASYFNAERLHLLIPDSLTPRGVKSLCEIPNSKRTIHDETRRDDVFAAIQWLARQPGVDKTRIAILGRSHGGQTVLSTLDRTDKTVQSQPIQPRAAIALYPGCARYNRMWNYEISAPLLIMIGALDDWSPSQPCVELHARIQRAQKQPPVELIVFPDSHHGFDSTGPVRTLYNIGNIPNGRVTVGGNAVTREQAYRRTFDFLSAELGVPLSLTHDERLKGHRYVVPAATGFASIDNIGAVPLNEPGRKRYQHYLTLDPPKAFVVTEKRGHYFSANDPEAMQTSLEFCAKARVQCWLYAVDHRVVWSADTESRIGAAKLRRKAHE